MHFCLIRACSILYLQPKSVFSWGRQYARGFFSIARVDTRVIGLLLATGPSPHRSAQVPKLTSLFAVDLIQYYLVYHICILLSKQCNVPDPSRDRAWTIFYFSMLKIACSGVCRGDYDTPWVGEVVLSQLIPCGSLTIITFKLSRQKLYDSLRESFSINIVWIIFPRD